MPVVKIQFFVLLGGTVFAWYNFLSEYFAWKKGKQCKGGCPTNAKSPFLTPCFGGAVFFTVAFILNLLI